MPFVTSSKDLNASMKSEPGEPFLTGPEGSLAWLRSGAKDWALGLGNHRTNFKRETVELWTNRHTKSCGMLRSASCSSQQVHYVGNGYSVLHDGHKILRYGMMLVYILKCLTGSSIHLWVLQGWMAWPKRWRKTHSSGMNCHSSGMSYHSSGAVGKKHQSNLDILGDCKPWKAWGASNSQHEKRQNGFAAKAWQGYWAL